MMLKNFLFYAFSTFINKWTAEDGAGFVFRTWGIVSLCLLATCIPMCEYSRSAWKTEKAAADEFSQTYSAK